MGIAGGVAEGGDLHHGEETLQGGPEIGFLQLSDALILIDEVGLPCRVQALWTAAKEARRGDLRGASHVHHELSIDMMRPLYVSDCVKAQWIAQYQQRDEKDEKDNKLSGTGTQF